MAEPPGPGNFAISGILSDVVGSSAGWQRGCRAVHGPVAPIKKSRRLVDHINISVGGSTLGHFQSVDSEKPYCIGKR